MGDDTSKSHDEQPRQSRREQQVQQPVDAAASPEGTVSSNHERPDAPSGIDGTETSDLEPRLDQAKRIIDGVVSDGASEAGNASHLYEEARQKYRSTTRSRFTWWDPFTRYERGMEILMERVPLHHPTYEPIILLCTRLQLNIDQTRYSGDSEGRRTDRIEIIGELNKQSVIAIELSFHELCRVTQSDSTRTEPTVEVPKTIREVADWYGRITWLERCHVIAACVLQGAPAHEVSRAANELYLLIEATYPVRQVAPADEHGAAVEPSGPLFLAVEDLLERTYTVTDKFDGAERLLWRDEGLDPLVRAFLTRQATMVGMRFGDRNFLDILEEWATRDNEERSWRAARLLAELWWRHRQDKVLELANTWAASDDAATWRGGAALLVGAYTAERAERPTLRASDSEVLRHLHNWANWRSDTEFAQVAAYTYGLIGRQWPEVALEGLDQMVGLGGSTPTPGGRPPLAVTVFVMFSYVEVAAAGHIRLLLARFAGHAAHYAYHMRVASKVMLEPERPRQAREQGLDMLYFHFVFVVALSLSGARQRGAHTPYSITVGLAPRPDMPSTRGQDVLLAGILSAPERDWRMHLETIFCAAISEQRDALVFDILASWVETVLYEPGAGATDALVHFIVSLRHQLVRWDHALHKSGLRAASAILEQRLRQWTIVTRHNLLRTFAQRVLDEIHETSRSSS